MKKTKEKNYNIVFSEYKICDVGHFQIPDQNIISINDVLSKIIVSIVCILTFMISIVCI